MLQKTWELKKIPQQLKVLSLNDTECQPSTSVKKVKELQQQKILKKLITIRNGLLDISFPSATLRRDTERTYFVE